MTDLPILSDPVTYFWKCPKKGFKQNYFQLFLNKMLVPHSATRLAAPVKLALALEYGVAPPDTILLSCYCTIWYCTVL